MSKLTLDFYLSLMDFEEIDKAAVEKINLQYLQYNEINPAKIEGGGRVIVSTKDGSYDIPEDAGQPLVYVGFDKDFKQTTEVICQ